MTRPRFLLTALGAVTLLAAGTVAAGAATSVKVINFSAKYSGTATVKVTDDVADISATGKGTGVPIGAGTVSGTGKGDTSQQPCASWGGTGVLKGTKGTITFKMLAGTQACGDEEGNLFSLVGRAQVTKATGKLAKAKGTLKVTGSYDRGAGTFTAKFAGKLKQ